MFEKYTESARRTIFFARKEVIQIGGNTIEPEHLLLAVLGEERINVPDLLHGREEAVKHEIRVQVENRYKGAEKLPTKIEVPLSPRTKDVLMFAAEESAKLSQKHIGLEHLLLGLLRAEDTFAAELLREHGIGHGDVVEVLKVLYEAEN